MASSDTFAGQIDEPQHETALAAQSTAALEVILHRTDQALLREQLDTSLRSRAVIDQALGILMA